jgi:predicted nucleic acid-binding protein
MLKYMLDTNICIFTIKNKPRELRDAFNRRHRGIVRRLTATHSPNHILHVVASVSHFYVDLRVLLLKHSKNLVSETLTDTVDLIKIENHSLKLINASKQPLSLRARDDTLRAKARKTDGYYGFVKAR